MSPSDLQRQRISQHTRTQRDAIVDTLRRLIGAQRDGEGAVQQIVAQSTSALGCEVDGIAYLPGDVPIVEEFASAAAIDAAERVSIVARRRGGGGRSLLLFAHPDSEPLKGLDRWRHDPFAGTITGGRIYGWGVADDLAGVGVLIDGLRVALGAGVAPSGDVILASAPSKRHARGVSALLHGGLSADAAVYLHPAESGLGMREIKAFASGQVEFRIMIDGQAPNTNEPSHTAFAHQAVNPVDKAWIVYEALRRLGDARAKAIHHPLLHDAVGRSTNLLVSHIAAGEALRPSRISPKCVLAGALSFPPPETLSSIKSGIERAVMDAANSDDWLLRHPPSIAWDSGVTAAETHMSHPLYRATAAAVLAVTGEQPHVNPMHTSSDIRNPIVQKNIPTVGFGPLCGDLTQNGRSDEWVDVEDHLRAVQVVAMIIADWCGSPVDA